MTLKIISTTDIHGAIFPTDYTSKEQTNEFGLARISSYLKEIRANTDVLYIDNGDAFQGTPLCTYAHQHLDEYTHPIAQAFNSMGLDYYNLGNHDFNYGKEVLFKFISDNMAKLLTSNVLFEGKPLGRTEIITFENKKIALIGVLTHYIPNWEQPKHIEGFEFLDAFETLQNEVNAIKNSVDYVIGFYHGGLERDPHTGEPTERLTKENQGYEMTSIKGLDILVTGHQHRNLIETINNVLVTQCTLKTQKFVEIDLDLNANKKNAKLIETFNLPVDNELLKPLLPIYNKVQSWLDQPVGSFKGLDLTVTDAFEARVNKHPLVSFINHVQQLRTGAQLSAVSLFDGVTGFKQTVSMRDLVSTYLYPNTLVVKRISGKTLKEMLEFSAYYFAIDTKGNLTFSPEYQNPKPQHYNYDMVDGIEYTINVLKPRDSRIVALTYQGKPIIDSDSFTIVLNNYRAMGGGNYWMIQESETIYEDSVEMIDVIMEYFQKYSPVKVIHNNNITIKY